MADVFKTDLQGALDRILGETKVSIDTFMRELAKVLSTATFDKNVAGAMKALVDDMSRVWETLYAFDEKYTKINAVNLIESIDAVRAAFGDFKNINTDDVDETIHDIEGFLNGLDSIGKHGLSGLEDKLDIIRNALSLAKGYQFDGNKQAVQWLAILGNQISDIGDINLDRFVDSITEFEQLSNKYTQIVNKFGSEEAVEEAKKGASKLKSILDEMRKELRHFLEANDLDPRDDRFSKYFDKITKGTITSREAITDIKKNIQGLTSDAGGIDLSALISQIVEALNKATAGLHEALVELKKDIGEIKTVLSDTSQITTSNGIKKQTDDIKKSADEAADSTKNLKETIDQPSGDNFLQKANEDVKQLSIDSKEAVEETAALSENINKEDSSSLMRRVHELKETSQSSKDAAEEVHQLGEAIDDVENHGNVVDNIVDANKVEETVEEVRQLDFEADNVAESVEKINNEMNAETPAIDNKADAIDNISESSNNAAESTEKLKENIDNISEASGVENVTAEMNSAAKSTEEYGNKLESAGNRMKQFAVYGETYAERIKAINFVQKEFNDVQRMALSSKNMDINDLNAFYQRFVELGASIAEVRQDLSDTDDETGIFNENAQINALLDAVRAEKERVAAKREYIALDKDIPATRTAQQQKEDIKELVKLYQELSKSLKSSGMEGTDRGVLYLSQIGSQINELKAALPGLKTLSKDTIEAIIEDSYTAYESTKKLVDMLASESWTSNEPTSNQSQLKYAQGLEEAQKEANKLKAEFAALTDQEKDVETFNRLMLDFTAAMKQAKAATGEEKAQLIEMLQSGALNKLSIFVSETMRGSQENVYNGSIAALARYRSELASASTTISNLESGTKGLAVSQKAATIIAEHYGQRMRFVNELKNRKDESIQEQEENTRKLTESTEKLRAYTEALRYHIATDQQRRSTLMQITELQAKLNEEQSKGQDKQVDAERSAQMAILESYRQFLSGDNTIRTKDISYLNGLMKDLGGNTKGAAGEFGDLSTLVNRFTERIVGAHAALRVFQQAKKWFKDIYKAVKDVDSAMVELKKVTNETSAGYEKFYRKAVAATQKIGASLSDMINATADFARLGYSTADATELAQVALVYKNVGDGINNVSDATESIISTMKAFGIEASNAIEIVDRFNEVGNNYAISSVGIGEAMKRSAAALAGAGNSIEESIGLIVGMNNVIQDPEKVGTALKTTSMFLRAAKTEIEDAGESADGCAESVSKLRGEMLALTGIDIMLDENTFKSTFQVYKELAEVWDNLSDVTQANVTNLLGGKRQANAIQALITNFKDAERAAETAANSSGSAMKENEQVLDSIQGKLTILKGTWEALSNEILDDSIVKFFLDLANGAGKLGEGFATVAGSIPAIMGLLNGIVTLGSKGNGNLLSVFSMIGSKIGFPGKDITGGFSLSEINLLKQYSDALASNKKNADALMNTLSGMRSEVRNAAAGFTGAASDLKNLGINFEQVTFRAKASAVAINIAKAAASTFISMGIGVVIGTVIKGITQSIEKSVAAEKELLEQSREAKRQLEEDYDAIEDKNAALARIADEYNELVKGVDSNGNNKWLSNEQYERFLELSREIADIAPDVVSGYNERKEAVLDYKNAVDQASGSLINQEEIARRTFLANYDYATRFSDISDKMEESFWTNESEYSSLVQLSKDAVFAIHQVAQVTAAGRKAGESFIGTVSAYDLSDKGKSQFTNPAFYQQATEGIKALYEKIIDASRKGNKEAVIALYEGRDAFLQEYKEYIHSFADIDSDEYYERFENALSSIGDVYSDIIIAIEDQTRYLIEYLNETEPDLMDGLTFDGETLLAKIIKDRFKTNTNMTRAEAKQMASAIAGDLVKIYSSEAYKEIERQAEVLDGSQESYDAYNESVKAFGETLAENGVLSDVVDAVTDSLYAQNKEVLTASDNYDMLTNSLKSYKEVLESIKDTQSVLEKAQSDMEKYGKLTGDTIASIMEWADGAGRDPWEFLTIDNGVITANTDAIKASIDEIKQAEIDNYEETKIAAEEAKAAEEERIRGIEEEADSVYTNVKNLAGMYGPLEEPIDEGVAELLDAYDKLKALNKEGNVDHTVRVKVEGQALIDAEWDGVDPNDIATLFTTRYNLGQGDEYDYEYDRNVVVNLTPITPDGEVLTPQELEDYVWEITQSGLDLLEADKIENGGKGLILKVFDVDESGLEEAGRIADEWAEDTHEIHADYYLTPFDDQIADSKARIDEYSQTIDDCNTNIALLSADTDATADSTKLLAGAFKDLSTGIQPIQDAAKTAKEAKEEFEGWGAVSSDTLKSLTEIFGEDVMGFVTKGGGFDFEFLDKWGQYLIKSRIEAGETRDSWLEMWHTMFYGEEEKKNDPFDNFKDAIKDISKVGDLIESINEDMADNNGFVGFDTFEDILDRYGEDWQEYIEITEDGFKMSDGWMEKIITSQNEAIDAAVEAGELLPEQAAAIKEIIANAYVSDEQAKQLDGFKEVIKDISTFNDFLGSIEEDMAKNDGFISLDTFEDIVDRYGDDWRDFVEITEDGFKMSDGYVNAMISKQKEGIEELVRTEQISAAEGARWVRLLKSTYEAEAAEANIAEVLTGDNPSAAISKVDSFVGLMSKAREEMDKYGVVTKETADSFKELMSDDQYASYFTETEEGITVNTEALKGWIIELINGSTASDQLKQALIELVDGYIEATDALTTYKDLLSDINSSGSLLSKIDEELKGGGVNSLDTVLSLINLVGEGWRDMVEITDKGFKINYDEVLQWQYDAIDAWAEETDATEQEVAALKEYTLAAIDAEDATSGLEKAFDGVTSAMESAEKFGKIYAEALTDPEQAMKDLISLLGESEAEKYYMVDEATGQVTIFTGLIDKMVSRVAKANPVIGTLLSNIYTRSKKATEPLDELKNVISGIGSVSSLMTDVGNEIAESGKNSLDTLSSLINLVGEGWEQYVDWDEAGSGFVIMQDALQNWIFTQIDALEVGEEYKTWLKEQVQAELELADATEKFAAANDKASSIMSNVSGMADHAEITYDTFKKLIDTDYRYVDALEMVNGRMTLNKEKYYEISEAVLKTSKAEMEAAANALEMSEQYQDLSSRLGELDDAELAEYNRQTALIKGYRMLASSVDNATSALKKFKNANSSANTENYDASKKAAEVINNVLYDVENKSGMYQMRGHEQYKFALDYFFEPNIDVDSEAFKEAFARVQRYLEEGEEGLANFQDDLEDLNVFDAGNYTQFTMSIEDMAKSLGISVDYLISLLDEYQQYYGEDLTFKTDDGEIVDLNTAVETYKATASDATDETETLDSKISGLQGTIEGLNGTTISLDTSPAEGAVQRLLDKVNELVRQLRSALELKASLDNNPNNGGDGNKQEGAAHVSGTPGAKGGKTLVGELGPEMVVDPKTNRYYTVGNKGPEFVNLPKGAVVFNAKQTADLLKSGVADSIGRALLSGNALATGTAFTVGKDGAKEIGEEIAGALASIMTNQKLAPTKDDPNLGSKKPIEHKQPKKNSKKKNNKKKKDKKEDKETKWQKVVDNLEKAINQANHIIKHYEQMFLEAERALNFSGNDGMKEALEGQVKTYQEQMEAAQKAINKLKKQGAKDSDEQLQKAEEEYWAAYNSMIEASDKLRNLFVDGLNTQIDNLQKSVSSLKTAAQEYGETGAISLDTFQDILSNGIQYLALLKEEDGQYVINEESIGKMVEAKKNQLAVEQALSYLAEVKEAYEKGETNRLNNLVSANYQVSNSTWDIVNAKLAELKALGMSDEQYNQVAKNIEALKAVTKTVSNDIVNDAKAQKEAYENEKEAVSDIFEEVKKLVKYENEKQVEAINKQIDAYKKIIDLKKESLDLSREEEDHQKTLAEKTNEIAKIQAKIDQLALDDSREAQAERAKLMEDLAEKQKDLADYQADYSYDKQVEALDKAAEKYEESRQDELDALENELSSEEKLVQKAKQRMSGDLNELYQALLDYNYEAGDITQDELIKKWEEASKLVEQYGSYLEAYKALIEKTKEEEEDPNYVVVAPKEQPKKTAPTPKKGNQGDPDAGIEPWIKQPDPRKVVVTEPEGEPIAIEIGTKGKGKGQVDGGNVTVGPKLTDGILSVGDNIDELLYVATDMSEYLKNKGALNANIDTLARAFDTMSLSVGDTALKELASAMGEVNNNNVVNFSPVISVTIDGSELDTEAAGREVANIAIEQLYDAFNRKGLSASAVGLL